MRGMARAGSYCPNYRRSPKIEEAVKDSCRIGNRSAEAADYRSV